MNTDFDKKNNRTIQNLQEFDENIKVKEKEIQILNEKLGKCE